MPPQRPGRAQSCLVTLAIVTAAAALGVCNLAWASQAWLPRTGQAVWMCASVRPSVNFRVAVWWQRRFSGKTGEPLKPYVRSNIACAFVPWASGWAGNGGLESSD